jgi:hypothetical protein
VVLPEDFFGMQEVGVRGLGIPNLLLFGEPKEPVVEV